MPNPNLFHWLVEYHCAVNLEAALPHIEDGRVLVRGKPLQEGFDENELYKGVLVVANGETAAPRLKADGVILEDLEPFMPVQTEGDFFAYLSGQRNSDGAHILDRVNGRIARAPELNNNPPGLPDTLDLYGTIPDDFLAYDGGVDLRNIGTKTRVAIKIPHAYPGTETFQIKRTAYTDLGMGKVTHFGSDHLVEEFFFLHDPVWKGAYVRPEEGIVGMWRTYERRGGRLVRASEKAIEWGALEAARMM